jgi:hypothetical protein
MWPRFTLSLGAMLVKSLLNLVVTWPMFKAMYLYVTLGMCHRAMA